jgi:hypothetical protein
VSLDIWWKAPPCPHCGRPEGTSDGHNITHNLNRLWEYLGCYEALYESDGRLAQEVGEELAVACDKLQEQTDEALARFNAPNGWGMVKHARPWLEAVAHDFLSAPLGAVVRVSR